MWHHLNRLASRVSKLAVIEKLTPKGFRGKLRPFLEAKSMGRLPDRRYMERSILPALGARQPARVLFVGVERYTCHYAKWFAKFPCEYWTLDIRPEVAEYGSPGRHVTGSVVVADDFFPANSFDVVLLNGVFGWGVDERADQDATIAALTALLKPGGILVLGWNDHRVRDPLDLPSVSAAFTHGIGSLPERVRFEGSTHVYDFFTKRENGRHEASGSEPS